MPAFLMSALSRGLLGWLPETEQGKKASQVPGSGDPQETLAVTITLDDCSLWERGCNTESHL